MSASGGRASLLGATLVLSGGRLLAFGAAFLVPVVLARTFSAGEFGTYKQVFLVYGTLFYAAQLGLATSLFYFVPRAPERAGRLVANSILMLGAAGGACVILLASQADALRWLLGNPRLGEHVAPLALYLVLMMLSAPLEILLVSRHRNSAAAATYAFSDLVRAALLVVPALVTGELRWVLAGAVAFAASRCLATAVWLRRELGPDLVPDRELARRQLAYSLPFGAAVLLGTLEGRLHEFVVAHHFDAATFAIYAVGCLQIPFVDFVATPAGDVMMVRMSERLREGRAAEARATWLDAVSGLALVFFPMAGLLILGAPEIIVLLFTSTYAASVPIFQLWSLGVLLAPFLTEGVLRVFAETRLLVAVNLVQLVVVAASIGPLLGVLGLRGAVLASLLALLAGRALALARIRTRLGRGDGPVLPWRDLGRVTAASLLAFAGGAAAKSIAGGGWPALIAGSAAFAAVYALLVWSWGLAPEVAELLRRAGARLSPPRVREGRDAG